MDAEGRSQVLRDALADPLHALGIEVQTLDLTPVGRRRVLRVGLARDVSGLAEDDHTSPMEPLTLDEVAEATRVVSTTLDAEPSSSALGQAPYTLEVGSAGVSAPLTEPRHFRRNVGRLVRVHAADDADAAAPAQPLTGRVLAVSGQELRLLVPGTPDGTEQVLPWAQVSRGVVQVEFTKPRAVDG